ncbi:FkbM family methyltransferase [Bradyrhizobium sp.]|uniref:FkbM family methyltransferase n=1 Tax=Bradyrhizobium sp. TaxID=376 RepID=UPI0039E5E3E2
MEYFLKRLLLGSLRLYFQHFPLQAGKVYVWNKIQSQRLSFLMNADLPARLKTGAIVEGSLRDVIHRQVFFFGVWERDVTAFYRAALRPGDIVIDIGAHIGTHTLLASHLVGPGSVHAIEASSGTFLRLKKNLEANQARNVTAYNVAVLDRTESVPMYAHTASTGRSTTIKVDDAAFIPDGIAEGKPLIDLLPQNVLSAASLIKIDVEGSEWLVIKGMLGAMPLLRHDVVIIVEITSITLADFGVSPADFLAPFEQAGFTPWVLLNDYDPFHRDGRLHPMLWKGCPECQLAFVRGRPDLTGAA